MRLKCLFFLIWEILKELDQWIKTKINKMEGTSELSIASGIRDPRPSLKPDLYHEYGRNEVPASSAGILDFESDRTLLTSGAPCAKPYSCVLPLLESCRGITSNSLLHWIQDLFWELVLRDVWPPRLALAHCRLRSDLNEQIPIADWEQCTFWMLQCPPYTV